MKRLIATILMVAVIILALASLSSCGKGYTIEPIDMGLVRTYYPGLAYAYRVGDYILSEYIRIDIDEPNYTVHRIIRLEHITSIKGISTNILSAYEDDKQIIEEKGIKPTPPEKCLELLFEGKEVKYTGGYFFVDGEADTYYYKELEPESEKRL